MTLAVAVDSAYPFDFSKRPVDCQVIMGYVGRDGYTPHVWTLPEVEAARATGCQWWPIGVGISGGPTNAADGHELAAVMIDRLPGYGVSKTTPVFQDLEPNALHADMAGAQACVTAWKTDMNTAGYPNTYTYSTDAPFIDWVANWTNTRPTTLPAGKVGVQYGGANGSQPYDLSVFDPALLTYSEGDQPLTQDEINAIAAAVWAKNITPNGTATQHLVRASDTADSASNYSKANQAALTQLEIQISAAPTAAEIADAVIAAQGSAGQAGLTRQDLIDVINRTHLATS